MRKRWYGKKALIIQIPGKGWTGLLHLACVNTPTKSIIGSKLKEQNIDANHCSSIGEGFRNSSSEEARGTDLSLLLILHRSLFIYFLFHHGFLLTFLWDLPMHAELKEG